MCGIMGYCGKSVAAPKLLDGLKRLEYRGYDSAGIALHTPKGFDVVKCKGRIGDLAALVEQGEHASACGIGHTRWATHGKPNYVNSHPHVSSDGCIALVHNGIVENYLALKSDLVNVGHSFVSQTDSEVAANLIAYHYRGDLCEAVKKAAPAFSGTFAFVAMSKHEPDLIVATCKDSPVIVGRGEDGMFVASDVGALAGKATEYFRLANGWVARITKDGCTVVTVKGKAIAPEYKQINADESADLGSYDSFMLKEIFEVPTALMKTFSYYEKNNQDLLRAAHAIKEADHVYFVACGTAYHACLSGRTVLDRFVRKHAECEVASEFRYRDPYFSKNEVCVFVSQSGETADTLAALRLAKSRGAVTVAVTNEPESTITTLADVVLPTLCGKEVAVASTKAYNAQLLVMYLLALTAGGCYEEKKDALLACVRNASTIDAVTPVEAAKAYASCNSVFFIGRGQDCAIAEEGALKLKEITYIPCQAYAAGELKHGTLALIEPGSLVVAIATDPALVAKTANAVAEVRSRGAVVMGVGTAQALREFECECKLVIPDGEPTFLPMYAIIPLQLFAYHVSLIRGTDADKPRNLAKSVTVE